MGEVQEARFYDKLYKKSERYHQDYHECKDFALWVRVRQLMRKWKDCDIVELGCGTGQLAHYLYDEGFKNYIGLDFSREALEIAGSFSKQTFAEVDIRYGLSKVLKERNLTEGKTLVFIATEVLEHIRFDRELIEEIPIGSGVIISVPSFDDIAHVRYFKTGAEVAERYGDLIDFTYGTVMDRLLIGAGVRIKKTRIPVEDLEKPRKPERDKINRIGEVL